MVCTSFEPGDDANTGTAEYVCLETVMEGELPGLDCCDVCCVGWGSVRWLSRRVLFGVLFSRGCLPRLASLRCWFAATLRRPHPCSSRGSARCVCDAEGYGRDLFEQLLVWELFVVSELVFSGLGRMWCCGWCGEHSARGVVRVGAACVGGSIILGRTGCPEVQALRYWIKNPTSGSRPRRRQSRSLSARCLTQAWMCSTLVWRRPGAVWTKASSCSACSSTGLQRG